MLLFTFIKLKYDQTYYLLTIMNLKKSFILLSALILTACSTQNPNEKINSIRLEPKQSLASMSLILSCDTSNQQAKAVITSQVLLKKGFVFTTDKNELNLEANVRDDLNVFSAENSKAILHLISEADTLKIRTSFASNVEFDLTKQKSELQNKLKTCI